MVGFSLKSRNFCKLNSLLLNIFVAVIYLLFQCDKLKEQIAQLKDLVAKKDDADPSEVRRLVGELQKASLKLFEMAYKKVIN